jgi:uroporphyrinogen-III synthase
MRVLVTRPAEDSARTAAALEAAGHEALIAPLFVIRPLDHAIPEQADAFIATSANALRHARLGQHHAAIPIFVVGDATAEEARRRGFASVHSARGDSHDLAAMLACSMPQGGLCLYLAGADRRDAALRSMDQVFRLQTIETYRSAAVEVMPAGIAAALKNGTLDAILHFSARSGAVFAALARQAGLQDAADGVANVFISESAVNPDLANSIVASRPDLTAMIDALERV